MSCIAKASRHERAPASGWLAAGLALAFSAASASAQQPTAPAQKQPKGWWHQPKAVAQLNLTTEQQAAIETAEHAYRESRATAMKGYSQAYAALLAALTAATSDTELLAKERTAMVAAWAELGKVNADRLIALRGILSAVQMEQLPKAAPGALRAGPVALRAIGEVGGAPAPNVQP
jgi:Spy/CpxP family protein refolding chaperone